MKHWMSLAFLTLFIPAAWSAPSPVVEENLYYNFKKNLLSKEPSAKMLNGFSSYEQSLYVDALWDLVDEGNTEVLNDLESSHFFHYELVEKLRLEILKIKYNKAESLSDDLVLELMATLQNSEVETKLIYIIAAYEEELLWAGQQEIIELAKRHPSYLDISQDEARKEELTKEIVADLFYNTPDVTTYMNGEYIKSVKIFMFCRQNRLYPCLMVMKDIHGEPIRNEDGSIWTHKSLASSARGLPSYVRNGNTPAGVWTIDSVMPSADQQISFGKFRRMILTFIPKSYDEKLLLSLLPPSSHNSDWWKPTVTARDIGRNLFRIHGTGRINNDPNTPYYPFMRTSGCIAQRENTYDGVTYKDQRELLDDIMKAMDLAPTYANETKVKGILYVMELDDMNAPVELEDLMERGIE